MILLLKKKVCESELDEIIKQDSSLLPFHKGKVYFFAGAMIASESISKVMFFSCIAEL